MAEKALVRLRNLLDLEAKTGWREKAFAGGASAFCQRWMPDAENEAVHPGLLREIGDRLLRYSDCGRDERERIVRHLLGLVSEPPPADPDLAHIDQVGTPTDRMAEPPTVEEARPQPRPRPQPPSSPRQPDRLVAPITTLKGIGPKKADLYARLGVRTVEDLIWHLPRRYDDFSRVRTVADVEPGEAISVVANLWRLQDRRFGFKKTMVQALFNDGSGSIRATWWNQPWIRRKLEIGKTYRLSGVVGLFMGHKTLENPLFEETNADEIKSGPILPVYPLTEGLTNRDVSRHVQQALQQGLAAIGDPLPGELRRRYSLTSLPNALVQLHQPESAEQLAAARRRIIFDELFCIQLGVQRRRRLLQASRAPMLAASDELLAGFQKLLPFALTDAQKRVLDEIRRDLARSVPMSRLIQGDVGSGKTVVAAGAMLIAAANDAQSALLAPTQILAEQHFRGLEKLLGRVARPEGTPLRVALLTGRVTGQERRSVLAGLADGSIDIVVGTTALIQEGVQFHNLGFVVVDEQHRFGVEQRAALRGRGEDGPIPHMLVMSATPIPRSLALTLYGDLDVSVIDELPPGRTPIKTKWFLPQERERLYSFLRRQVQKGRQGYVIYPLVEESDKLDVGAAVEAYARLRTEIFPDLRLGLLHGRLSGREKDEVMRAFAAGEIDVLVSTSVVEVGVDVPNATVMLIEDAERFGLAQLHQFRGRVGRGEHESYCALISKADNAAAAERLNVLVETTDGFVLAEKDLELRGPGDFLGTRQSGLPDLKMAALSDIEVIALAQQAARELVAEDPDLAHYPHLRAQVERFWRGHGDVS